MAPGPHLDANVDYLREVQYRDSSQLAKRANVHVAYRTAPMPAFDWLADLVDWPAYGGAVLDVGCGSGALWQHVAAVAPSGLRLTLSDLSPGMVAEAVARAVDTGAFDRVEGHTADARELPFGDDSYDIVTCTYALYHVPEPIDAVTEIVRVVRPGGTVAIMTNGPGHLAEIERLRSDVFGPDARYQVNHTFAPAVAAALLVERFDHVQWRRYDDTLAVTDAEALLAFVTSTPPATEATPRQLASLRRRIDAEMESGDGVFRVSKHTGAFVCRAKR